MLANEPSEKYDKAKLVHDNTRSKLNHSIEELNNYLLILDCAENNSMIRYNIIKDSFIKLSETFDNYNNNFNSLNKSIKIAVCKINFTFDLKVFIDNNKSLNLKPTILVDNSKINHINN